MDSEKNKAGGGMNAANRKQMESVGSRIKKLRRQHKMTQKEFAQATGISIPTLSKMETGALLPGGQNLIRMHKVFGTDIGWLLLGAEAEHGNILELADAAGRAEKIDLFLRLYGFFAFDDAQALIKNEPADVIRRLKGWQNSEGGEAYDEKGAGN